MKKIVIVGGGTAGLLTAGLMHKFWDDNVQITLIFDHKNASIGVGESTTPIIHKIIDLLGLDELDLIEKLGTTAKLGVNFKDWIPGTEYFHGFIEVDGRRDSTNFIEIREDETSAIYSIMNDEFNGGPHFNKAVNNVPHEDFNKYAHALHIDTQKFADLFLKDLQGKIEIIDDVVERVRVNPECNEISHIECKKSVIVNADFFVDCTGFACVLFKHLILNGLILHLYYLLIEQFHNRFQIIQEKFLHILWHRQQRMDGFGDFLLEIDLEQDIFIHLNSHLMRKQERSMMLG